MIDFEREEAELSAAVGLSSAAILAALGSPGAQKLADARARFGEFVAEHEVRLTQSERLERDRLDSLMQSLYGRRGLLARAGALVALQDRLHRIAALAPRCLAAPDASDRLRREALITRTFAREQVSRAQTDASSSVAHAVGRMTDAVARLDEFCSELQAAAGDKATARRAFGLYTVSDLADQVPEPLNLGDGIAFVLRRLADASYVRDASKHLDQLCASHVSLLRDALWEAAEGGYARRESAATLVELTELDVTLEALKAKLTDARVDSTERCAAIAQLYAQVASARAEDAAFSAARALAPIRETISVGIDAEVGS